MNLRPATAADFDFIYGLYMHPAINTWLLYEQMQAETFRPIFEELLQQQVLYVLDADAKPAAMCKLVPQKYRNSHIVYLGGVAVHPQYSGRGLGGRLMNAVVAFAEERGFKRIELSVATHNEKAIQLYRNAGFEKEGVLRKFTYLASKNEYWDEMMMARVL